MMSMGFEHVSRSAMVADLVPGASIRWVFTPSDRARLKYLRRCMAAASVALKTTLHHENDPEAKWGPITFYTAGLGSRSEPTKDYRPVAADALLLVRAPVDVRATLPARYVVTVKNLSEFIADVHATLEWVEEL